MPQTLRLAVTRRLSNLKAFASVKTVYTLAFALLLATGTLVVFPLSNTLAADCSANCNQGEKITITWYEEFNSTPGQIERSAASRSQLVSRAND